MTLSDTWPKQVRSLYMLIPYFKEVKTIYLMTDTEIAVINELKLV